MEYKEPQWPNDSLGSFFSIPVHFQSQECFCCIESFFYPLHLKRHGFFSNSPAPGSGQDLELACPVVFLKKSNKTVLRLPCESI